MSIHQLIPGWPSCRKRIGGSEFAWDTAAPHSGEEHPVAAAVAEAALMSGLPGDDVRIFVEKS